MGLTAAARAHATDLTVEVRAHGKDRTEEVRVHARDLIEEAPEEAPARHLSVVLGVPAAAAGGEVRRAEGVVARARWPSNVGRAGHGDLVRPSG